MTPGCDEFRGLAWSRRKLLSAGVSGIGALCLPTLLQAEGLGKRAAKAKHLLFLHQFGGPSHIDTFDMKPHATAGIRGEFKPIATSAAGVQICEHLPKWAKAMHHCALVRSVHHPMKNHNSATYYSLTGHAPPLDDIRLRDTPELHPCYGSVAAKLRPAEVSTIPSFVSLPHVLRDGSVTPGQHASFLGKRFDPFFLHADPSSPQFRLPELSLPADLPLARLDQRKKLLDLFDQHADLKHASPVAQGIDRFYERALSMLVSPRVKQAFDLTQETPALRDRYGRTTYGQSCLLARRLLEAGVRVATVYFSDSIGGAGASGWDTHQNNFNDLKKRLLPPTDQTVSALLEDLHDRGMLEETLVVWMGEFGRAPKIGDRDAKGRNHWPHCYTVVFAGGGVHGGAVYGASDAIGGRPALKPAKLDDIAATMFWALGIDPASEVNDAAGRPSPISYGTPITELFS